ncbi:radical SAM protein [Acidobacteriota bacterium]
MTKGRYFPQKIYIERENVGSPLTKRILRNASQVPVEIIERANDVIEAMKLSKDVIGEGKKYLLITKQKGEFVKPCPCTPQYIGCNYSIINLDINCPLECSYCILQLYLNNPLITVYANIQDLWKQLDAFLFSNRDRSIRIGTGELGDSLAFDHITENSRALISYFRDKDNVLFEMKTKTINIDNILKEKPVENVIIAWSLNSKKIAQEEEMGAPSVEERISAARRITERGFRVAFHFDPIIRYSGWESDYADVVRELVNNITPSRIAWISLGSLRFPPSLKLIIQRRFPQSKIIYEEFVRGRDGKLRYFKPLRFEQYKRIIRLIEAWGGGKIPLYFCMETEEFWRKMLKKKPRSKEDIEKYLSLPLG